jgi:Fur family zinc uptake transcriptional regulator
MRSKGRKTRPAGYQGDARLRGRNAKKALEVLSEARKPLSAYEVLDRLAPSGITAPTTVYRALSRLVEEGLVHRLDSLNAYIVCDGHHAQHSEVMFVVCRVCHATEEITVPGVADALCEELADRGFSVAGANIEIKGVCAHCSTQRGKD